MLHKAFPSIMPTGICFLEDVDVFLTLLTKKVQKPSWGFDCTTAIFLTTQLCVGAPSKSSVEPFRWWCGLHNRVSELRLSYIVSSGTLFCPGGISSASHFQFNICLPNKHLLKDGNVWKGWNWNHFQSSQITLFCDMMPTLGLCGTGICCRRVCRYANDSVISFVFVALISGAESADPCQWLKPASNVNTSAKPPNGEILVSHKVATLMLHHRWRKPGWLL